MQLNLVDVYAKHARATYLAIDGKEMRFCLAIRRLRNDQVNRWCFYVALAEEEYSFLVKNQHRIADASFLAMSSTVIGVHKQVCDAFFLPQPERFVGKHVNSDPFESDWSNASIEANLAAFYEYIKGAFQHETAA